MLSILILPAFAQVTAPQNAAPVDGAIVADHTPTLSAYTVAGDVAYTFTLTELSGAEVETSPPLTSFDGNVHYQVLTLLDEDTWYCFTVVAQDLGTAEVSDPSAETCFFANLTNDPPSVPQFVDLAEGDVVSTATTFWIDNGVDPEDRGEEQQWELHALSGGLLDSFTHVTTGAGQSDWAPAMDEDTAYLLRVRASDGSRVSAWNEVALLASASNDAPASLALLRPRDGVRLDEVVALEARNAVDPEGDALSYAFEVLDAEGQVVASAQDVAEGPSSTAWLPESLPDGTYTWSVVATDDQGAASEPSEVWTFHIGPADEAPGRVGPAPSYAGYQGGWGCSSAPVGGAGFGALLAGLAGLLLRRRR